MKRVLFINHDIIPYVAETELARMGRLVPKTIQESGCEIRTFMPRWGNINERRGQLHEVIRLSGLNIAIKEIDHPLIIKVASIVGTKVQVYFIDNEEFFQRKGQTTDANGKAYKDNGERAVFFARGVIETIKKLRWIPDVIHCQGWMTSLVPLFIKTLYSDEPAVANAKIVTSLFSESKKIKLEKGFKECVKFGEITDKTLEPYKDSMDINEMQKIAIDYSDGIIQATDGIDEKLLEYAQAANIKFANIQNEDFAAKYLKFYDSLSK
jgi:starch synthase